MMVTESKLTELMGYTRNEIKARRQLHWLEGLHYAFDPGRKILYNVEQIQLWANPKAGQLASEICEDVAKYDGMRATLDAQKFCHLHGIKQMPRRRHKYV